MIAMSSALKRLTSSFVRRPRRAVPVCSTRMLMGQPPHEFRGGGGNGELPKKSKRGGVGGKKGSPPRERAEGERRSFKGRKELAAAEHPLDLVAPLGVVEQVDTRVSGVAGNLLDAE